MKAVVLKRLEELGEETPKKEVKEKKGIERRLRVIRVGPNPRMVVCEYWELASRRVCVVNVRVNRKWKKGMELVMEEPREELAYRTPWLYVGKQPRRIGKW